MPLRSRIHIPGHFKLGRSKLPEYNKPEIWAVEVDYYDSICHNANVPSRHVTKVMCHIYQLEFKTEISGWRTGTLGVRIG